MNKKRFRTSQFEYKNIKPDIAEADTSGHLVIGDTCRTVTCAVY